MTKNLAPRLVLAVALAALILPASLSVPALAQLGGVQTKRFGITSYDRVQVQGDMIVDITASSSITAVAEGPRDSLDALSLDVQDRVLTIRQAYEGPYGQRRPTDGPVHIRLTAQNLASVTLAGSGSVRAQGLRGPDVRVVLDGAGSIDANVPAGTAISARAVGSGTITLTGQSRTLTASTRGAGGIDASGLTVRTLDARVVGSGASRFAATGTANLVAMGSANITVTGNPVCTMRNAGAGHIDCGTNIRNSLETGDQPR